MPCCDVGDAGLARQVGNPLAGFAGDEGVEPGGDRLQEFPLGAAADDADAPDELVACPEQQRGLLVQDAAARRQLARGDRLQQPPLPADGAALVLRERSQLVQPQPSVRVSSGSCARPLSSCIATSAETEKSSVTALMLASRGEIASMRRLKARLTSCRS